jgi:hypothetical protein
MCKSFKSAVQREILSLLLQSILTFFWNDDPEKRIQKIEQKSDSNYFLLLVN